MTHPLVLTKQEKPGAGEYTLLGLEGQRQLCEMLELFLRARDLAPLSKALYERAVTKFIQWLAPQNFHPATVGLEYRDHLLALYPDSPRTIAAYTSPLRQFFNFMKERGRAYTNPFAGVKTKVQSDIYDRPCLTPDEADHLLSSLRSETLTEARDKALITLILHTGLRIAEAVSTSIEHIEEREGVPVLTVKGKGRQARDDFVVLVPGVLEALTTYLERTGRRRDGKGPLFLAHNRGDNGGRLTKNGAQKSIARRLREAGLKRPDLAAHSLRHTAATCALRNGATPFEVSKMLRHRSLASTMIYLHAQDRLTKGAEYKVAYGKKSEAGSA
jgi:site-specific recombinase XerD